MTFSCKYKINTVDNVKVSDPMVIGGLGGAFMDPYNVAGVLDPSEVLVAP